MKPSKRKQIPLTFNFEGSTKLPLLSEIFFSPFPNSIICNLKCLNYILDQPKWALSLFYWLPILFHVVSLNKCNMMRQWGCILMQYHECLLEVANRTVIYHTLLATQDSKDYCFFVRFLQLYSHICNYDKA